MMITILLFSALVYQSNDTLNFMAQDSVVEQWILGEKRDSIGNSILKLAKVAPNHKRFFIWEERDSLYIPVETKITLYNAARKIVWTEMPEKLRILSFDLSNVFDSLLIIVDTDESGKDPRLFTIKNHKKDTIVDQKTWLRIIDYKNSPNYRYLVLHTRRRQAGKLWDFIDFHDLVEKTSWEYMYPICVSCKKTGFEMQVGDEGQVEIIGGSEHRIFAGSGRLLNYFVDPD